ncbi:hypothetical protein EJ02DRAFT_146444 [Clathrospora elynae]|uniref:C2H2-type domain-containing protein n=1 Tax=Clathrospora elynae TaxID=706981 RepID=A0A6A5SUC0_9PLEO|nr:hypothetical protein EJ02DRAFT_146444 [Clathrospora elynae]
MDALSGKNSTGRRVSLLNDGPAPPPQLARLPSITPSLRSWSSSYVSSPIGSPTTPRLVRSDSSDSNMQTPSPITPDFVFDQGMDSPGVSNNGFFSQQKELNFNLPYAAISHPHPAASLAYHNVNAQHAYFRQQPLPEPLSDPAPVNPRPKKNSYPCPMAKEFNCNDYFTTSGHAARHAKKHTGKKDSFCPECNKAFTRKDNMEQHRRTHQTGRNVAKGGDRDVKKAKQNARRPKPAPLQSSILPLSSLAMVDPTLPPTPTGPFLPPAVQPTDPFFDFNTSRSPYPDPSVYSYHPSASYGGLDALAMAASASGDKRAYI